MRKIIAFIILFLIPVIVFSGCANSTAPSSNYSETIPVRIVATRYFGSELLFDRTAEIAAGTTAEKALEQIAEVNKAGSYVEGIEGVFGDTEIYWFYYINGIMANVFASGYKLQPGDMQHWDFHDYSYIMHGCNTIIGDYPEPFLHGYGGKVLPTIVVYSGNLEDTAKTLKQNLEKSGVAQVTIRSDLELSEDEKAQNNLILLCDMDSALIQELNEVYDRIGFFACFNNGKLQAFNSQGKLSKEYGANSAVIQASQSIWNPRGSWNCETVVMLIAGTDEDGIRSAVESLTGNFTEMQYASAVVISGGEIIKIPFSVN